MSNFAGDGFWAGCIYATQPLDCFLTEDSYLGNIIDPLTLNRYNYVKSSPLNYVDPSGHEAFSNPNNQTSAYNKPGGSGSTSSGSTPQYQTGSPSNATSPYTKQAACKEISEEIKRHQGALLGAGVGIAIILITAATGGAPILAVVGASAAYAGSGLIIGGALQKGLDSAYIAHKLKTEYGINVAEYQDIEVSQLPEEAQTLCERFEENGEDMETYLEVGTALSAAGAVLYEAGILLDKIGSTVKESSVNAFERIKNWVSGITKGGSGAGLNKKLMNELAESGVKYNADDVIMVTKTADEKLVWLEKGNSSAGYQHILNHADEFATKGITSNQLPDFISSALSKGKIVGMQGTRPIYEVMYNGSLQRVAITVGNNGFIVGANPVSLP